MVAGIAGAVRCSVVASYYAAGSGSVPHSRMMDEQQRPCYRDLKVGIGKTQVLRMVESC